MQAVRETAFLTIVLLVWLSGLVYAEASRAILDAADLTSQSRPLIEHTAPSSDRQGDPTLSELWEGSDLVVEVSVGQSRPTDYVPAGRPPSIFTTYDCQIIALFKSPDSGLSVGHTIAVRRSGGLRDRGDHLDDYHPANEFRFEQGDRYILFLRERQWMGDQAAWGMYYTETFSAASTFKVVGTTIETKGLSRAAEDLQGSHPDALREHLQRLGRATGAEEGQTRPVTNHTGPSSDRLSNATLDDLWEQSDRIVEVSVGQSQPTDYEPAGRPPSIFTTYDCHIVAVFKTSDAELTSGQTVPVRRNGGIRDRGDHIDNYEPANEFRLEQGDRYILFLRRRQWMGAEQYRGVYYEETVGGASTFKIVGTYIHTNGVTTVADELQGTRVEWLREHLQRLATSQ